MRTVTAGEPKRALLVAFHFPPFGASSGLQRTLSFSRHLEKYGWNPIVLSANARAYDKIREDQLNDIPENVVVKRAFALDARRHLAVGGWYPLWLASPDRWSSWFIGGLFSGLNLVRRYRPAVIWSTFPIATAHLLGLAISRLTGLPWIADFRDPLTEPDYPIGPGHLWLERQTVAHAARLCFTTPSTLRMYAERYPREPISRWVELPNGYDEAIFRSVDASVATGGAGSRPLTLVHSGLLYPVERDPRPFFAALSRLRAAGTVSADDLRIVLRATGHDRVYAASLAEFGIEDIVELAEPLPYRLALREMLEADGLLVFQAASCNIQIPAKIYECLRARRPIFALTDSAGDTASVLRAAGLDTIVPLDDSSAIASGLQSFLDGVRGGTAPIPSESAVLSHSRETITGQLAACFETVATEARDRRA